MTHAAINRRQFLSAAALSGGACLAARLAQGSAGRCAQAANQAALLEQARAGIRQHRQGEAVIRVTDDCGRPVTGYRLKATQLTHDFSFGCYLTFRELPPEGRDIYRQSFSRLFNYATLGVYWRLIQADSAPPDWNQISPETAFAGAAKLRLKGHPLIWGAHEAGTPRWLPRAKGELEAVMKERITEAVTRWRGMVRTWDVVNEPLDGGLFDEVLGGGYISRAFRYAREADAQAQLALNEYGILSARSRRRTAYFRLLKKLRAEGAPVDVIGIQAHEPRDEWFDPAVVRAALDQLAALSLPIHITEFTAQADDAAVITGGYRTGRWSERSQADYYREFFTLCFGHPQVEAITVWGLDDRRAWLRNCALLDQQWQPKAAFQTLDELLNHDWRTRAELTVTTDRQRLRGFYGDYEISVQVNGQPAVTRPFALRRNQPGEWLIRLPGQAHS